MSFTIDELRLLKAAYASGVLEVRYDGKVTRYDDGPALLRRIRVVEAELAKEAGQDEPSSLRVTYVGFDRA
ncbi:phage head-tail joining protein [Aestuariibius insulae]|uniref:phage head-tail joining protein n=1 Tax=Aestuariibius insulae TaxID=2058287 RepID=UPI00345EFDCF